MAHATPARSGLRTAATCALLLASLPLTSAPVPALELAPQGFSTQVRFANRSAQQRREWGLATVPFPRGVWTAGRQFAVAGRSSTMTPFGARWPDGSVRFAQLAVSLDMAPSSEQLVRVSEVAPSGTFRLSPWVQARMPSFDFALVASVNGTITTAPLRALRVVESDSARATVLYRDRVPGTDLVYDLWLTFFSDQDSVRFELRVTNSRIGSPKFLQPVDWIAMVTTDAVPIIRGAYRSNIVQTPMLFRGPNIAVLMHGTHFFDGQAHDWWGDLLFHDPRITPPDAARRISTFAAQLYQPLFGVATNWDSSYAFGPFGHLPEAPPWITDGGRQAALIRRATFDQWLSQRGTTWEDRPLGLIQYAASTGLQHDFGVAKLVDTFYSAMPDNLEEARHCAAEEAHRPVHFREADGTPLRATDHPDWVALAGRAHYSDLVSPDRLGKPVPELSAVQNAHGWTGKDAEHWSSNTLAAAYLLTGSHSLRMELENEVELFKSSHTLPSLKPGWTTNAIGRGRAVGRTLLTMSWVYLCTGRRDLSDWMVERIRQCVIPQYYGFTVAGPVKPIDVMGPDARVLPNHESWSGWGEAQAVLGLEAAAQVTGLVTAHQLAFLCAKSLYTYGWQVQQTGALVGYGIAMLPGGRPLTPQQYADPNFAVWSSAGFNVWCLPATQLAVLYGLQYNDNDLATRAWAILRHTEAQRFPPRDNPLGWDDYAGWDGVW